MLPLAGADEEPIIGDVKLIQAISRTHENSRDVPAVTELAGPDVPGPRHLAGRGVVRWGWPHGGWERQAERAVRDELA